MNGPHRAGVLRGWILVVLVALLLTACQAGTSASPVASASPGTVRPIIVDSDLGADDLLALAILVRDPTLRVEAITVAGTGLVHCAPGLRNLRSLLHQLDADPIPIGCGSEDGGPDARPFPDEWRAATDAAYSLSLPSVPSNRSGEDAVELLGAKLLAADDPVTLVVLGPWTNLEAVFAARPELADRVGAIHAMGGTLDAPGNVFDEHGRPLEPSLEWNLAADPSAVAAVLELGIPTRFVALDATDQIPVDRALYARFETTHDAAGMNLAYELYTRNGYMLEGGNFLWDPLAALTVIDPALVTWERTGVRVTPDGPAGGHLERAADAPEAELSIDVDPEEAVDAFVKALGRSGPRADPFALAGTLSIRWDGQRCSMEADDPAVTGVYRLAFDNQADGPAGVALLSVAPPRTWDDLVGFAATLDPAQEIPEWLSIGTFVGAEAAATGEGMGELVAGMWGPVCVTGDAGSEAFFPGNPVTFAP